MSEHVALALKVEMILPNAIASLPAPVPASNGSAPKGDAKVAGDDQQDNFDQMARDAADTEQTGDAKPVKAEKTAKAKAGKEAANDDDNSQTDQNDDAADDVIATTVSVAPAQAPAPGQVLSLLVGTHVNQAAHADIGGKPAPIEADNIKIEPGKAQIARPSVPSTGAPETTDGTSKSAKEPTAPSPTTTAASDTDLKNPAAKTTPPDPQGTVPQDTQELVPQVAQAPAPRATPPVPVGQPIKTVADNTTSEDSKTDAAKLVSALEALKTGGPDKVVPPEAQTPTKSAPAPQTAHAEKTQTANDNTPAADQPAAKLANVTAESPLFADQAKTASDDHSAAPVVRIEQNVSGTPAVSHVVDMQTRPAITAPVISVRAQSHDGQVHLPTEQIAIAITRQSRQGNNRFEIRLDPPELGRIDVKLEVSSDGRATASLTADRQDTLDLLTRDSRSLQKTLADAGFNTDGDALRFALRDDGNSQKGNRSGAQDAPAGKDVTAAEDTTPPPVAVQMTASLGAGRLDLRV